MDNKFFTAKEIAKKYVLSYQVINRYTDVGLLPPVFKKGNKRFYSRKLVEKRMKEVLSLIRQGYPLFVIRKKLVGI
jgi:DNA-binding transcriptional MerR regulator